MRTYLRQTGTNSNKNFESSTSNMSRERGSLLSLLWKDHSSRRFVLGNGVCLSYLLGLVSVLDVNTGFFLMKSTLRVQRLWSVSAAFSRVILPRSHLPSRGPWNQFPATQISASLPV